MGLFPVACPLVHDYVTSVTRRNVVILCNVKSRLIPKRQQPGDEEDILDFLMECVSVYLSQPCMPISIENLLYTILGNAYNEVRDDNDIAGVYPCKRYYLMPTPD